MGRKPKNQINQTQNQNTENQDQPIIEEENLVKKTCRELGITQKELAEIMGIHEGTIRNWSSNGDLPQNAINHMNLLINYKQETSFKIKFKELLKAL